MRSSAAQTDLDPAVEGELAVEVQHCPLRSRTGSEGSALSTAIVSWQLRSGKEDEEEEKEEEGKRACIQSNNPHLASGKQTINSVYYANNVYIAQ